MAVKEWFTAQELAGMPGMPETYSAVIRWAKKKLDQKNLAVVRRKLQGKGLEYAAKCLPETTQSHIQSQVLAAAFTGLRAEARFLQPGSDPARLQQGLPAAVVEDILKSAVDHFAGLPAHAYKRSKPLALKSPAKAALVVKKTSKALTLRHAGGVQVDGSCIKSGQVRTVKTVLGDKDRDYQDAALILMHTLDDAMRQSSLSARKAAQALAAHIMDGTAAPELRAAAVTVYIKPRGVVPLGGLDALTARLQKMHGFYQEGWKLGTPAAFLIAGRPEKRGINPIDLRAFMHFYCLPNRPTVMQSWKNSAPWYAEQGIDRPAVDTWYRLEKGLPVTVKYRGRMTGAAYKSLLPYISRDETMFKSNDIWVGDGHTFKARVQSPIHGQAFRPEVTFIIDWRSRKIVGWSVALSENVTAVSDAFRHAQITTRARPLVYYSDNGSGQTGKHIDHPMTGTLGRQGIAHETGIPGSPQGRGIIERLWAITLIALAITYPTFVGKQGDKETIRKIGVELEKAKRKGETSRFLPSWRQFVADLEKCVKDYNQLHDHSGIDGMKPDEAYAKYMDPDSTALYVSDAELNELWMPEEIRVYDRGLIQLFGNEYYCPELMTVLGEKARVRVRFDIHNADTVRILDLKTGQFLALAVWDGHRRAAFPVTFIEDQRQKRADGIKRRAQGEIDRADDELMLTYDSDGKQVLPFGAVPVYSEESLIPSDKKAQLTPKAAKAEPAMTRAERMYGAQVEAEDRAREAAKDAPPVLSYGERLLLQQAAEAQARANEPVIETREARMLRQIEEQDALAALILPKPDSETSEEEGRKAV